LSIKDAAMINASVFRQPAPGASQGMPHLAGTNAPWPCAAIGTAGGGASEHVQRVAPGMHGQPAEFGVKACGPLHRLEVYEAVVAAYLRNGLRSDLLIARHDRRAIGQLVDDENDRHPGLNLILPTRLHGLADMLPPPGCESRHRLIFRPTDIDMPPLFFADVHMRAGEPPSIILMEPGRLGTKKKRLMYGRFAVAVRTVPAFARARMSIVETELQCNAADTLMFALSLALNAHKHAATLLGWHNAQRLRQAIGKHDNALLAQDYARIGYQLCGGAMLPEDFLEHAQDSGVLLDRYLASPEGNAEGRGKLLENYLALLASHGEPPSIERWRHALILRSLAVHASSSPHLSERGRDAGLRRKAGQAEDGLALT
jgi:hypothetical protein